MENLNQKWYVRGSGYADYIRVMAEESDDTVAYYHTTKENYNTVLAKVEIMIEIHNSILKLSIK